uniref:Uncharacterized protein n=1 Tax=Plectus sambesii TaxID=2011161 RepID=A0A914W4L8_9BILA
MWIFRLDRWQRDKNVSSALEMVSDFGCLSCRVRSNSAKIWAYKRLFPISSLMVLYQVNSQMLRLYKKLQQQIQVQRLGEPVLTLLAQQILRETSVVHHLHQAAVFEDNNLGNQGISEQ